MPCPCDTAFAVVTEATCAAREAAWARSASPNLRTLRVTTKSAPSLATCRAVLRSATWEIAQRHGPFHSGLCCGDNSRSQKTYSGLNASIFICVCVSYELRIQPTG